MPVAITPAAQAHSACTSYRSCRDGLKQDLRRGQQGAERRPIEIDPKSLNTIANFNAIDPTLPSAKARRSSQHTPHAALKRREQRLPFVRRHRFASLLESRASLALILWRNSMTKLNLMSAALIAAAMIATPAMARESHATSRNAAENAYAATSDVCIRAPRVGAFATQPWTNPPCEPTSGF
jgi:hypothetical protein